MPIGKKNDLTRISVKGLSFTLEIVEKYAHPILTLSEMTVALVIVMCLLYTLPFMSPTLFSPLLFGNQDRKEMILQYPGDWNLEDQLPEQRN